MARNHKRTTSDSVITVINPSYTYEFEGFKFNMQGIQVTCKSSEVRKVLKDCQMAQFDCLKEVIEPLIPAIVESLPMILKSLQDLKDFLEKDEKTPHK